MLPRPVPPKPPATRPFPWSLLVSLIAAPVAVTLALATLAILSPAASLWLRGASASAWLLLGYALLAFAAFLVRRRRLPRTSAWTPAFVVLGAMALAPAFAPGAAPGVHFAPGPLPSTAVKVAALVYPDRDLPLATVALAGHPVEVEIASTPAQWERGLMWRHSLAPGHGMLFVFPSASRQAFWMKNTLIPLDILFFDSQGTLVASWASVPPCHASPCRTYPSGRPARYVLEMPSGSARALHLPRAAVLAGMPQ